jgi:5-methylcytosine-specific restriction endonuclease McrA
MHENKGRSGQSLYRTKRWQITRRRVLFNHPLCRECDRIATDVDHITPLAEGGDPYNLANLQPLCQRCHGRKTKAEQLTIPLERAA